MTLRPRIGVRIGPADPYWVQMREVVWNQLRRLDADPYEIDLSYARAVSPSDQQAWVKTLLSYGLNALIVAYMPDALAQQVLASGLPIIHLTESALRHPRWSSAIGYYDIARTLAGYVAQQIGGRGEVLVVGGVLARYGEDGRSRVRGVQDVLGARAGIALRHIPSAWRYDRALPQIETALRGRATTIDAIIGLSDSVALAARDAASRLDLIHPQICVVGINGDPLALAAISEGTMTATMDTAHDAFGAAAAALAIGAARGETLPQHIGYTVRLVTAANVREVAADRLMTIANLPSHLVGVRHRPSMAPQPLPSRAGPAVLVQRAIAYIHQHHARELTRHEIAAYVGVSENYLTQIFNRETGSAPWEYLNAYRVRRARELLQTTGASITAIAQEVGFEDPAYFSRVFRRIEGVSPREFRSARGAPQ